VREWISRLVLSINVTYNGINKLINSLVSIKKHFRLSRGFTLVELLVVIAIIGILATLLLLQLGVARQRARDVKRIADVNQLRTSVELYYDDNGSYPADITITELSKYMVRVPTDPLVAATTYGYKTKTAAKLQYQVWTELEQKALGALNADADINASAWAGPGNARGGVDGRGEAPGVAEACANSDTTDNECVYDQGQNM